MAATSAGCLSSDARVMFASVGERRHGQERAPGAPRGMKRERRVTIDLTVRFPSSPPEGLDSACRTLVKLFTNEQDPKMAPRVAQSLLQGRTIRHGIVPAIPRRHHR